MTLEDSDEVFLLAHGFGGKQIVALKGATPAEGDEVLLLPEGDKYVAIKPGVLHEGDRIALIPIGGQELYVAVGRGDLPCTNILLNPCLSSSANWVITQYLGTVAFGVSGGIGGCATHATFDIPSNPYGGFKVAMIQQNFTPQTTSRVSFWYKFSRQAGSDYQFQMIPGPGTLSLPEVANWTRIQRLVPGSHAFMNFTLGGYTPNKIAHAEVTAVCIC
jgi:hypothetical protein